MANSLWQRIKGLFGAGGIASSSAGGLLGSVLQSGKAPTRGTKELLQAYRTHPWFHTVVHRIAGEVSQQHFKLYRSKKSQRMESKRVKSSIGYAPHDAVEVDTHPLLALLENPNPKFTRAMFFHLVSAYLDTKGEVPIVIERGANGQPKELWPVPPHWLAEIPHQGFPFYRFSFGAWQRTIPEDDVIYLAHPDLEQPYARGVGTGETLADEIDIDEFATKHLKSWFFNRALPDVFLSVEGVTSEAEALRYEEKLRGKHGGRQKAFQVHVTSGKVDVKQLGHTFREQQLPELRSQQRDTVMQVFGVPPEIMGIVENSNRATIDAAELILTRFVVVPRVSFLADGFTHWAKREYSDDQLTLGFESPVPQDAAFALEVMTSQPGLFTKNEWRELAGRAPVDGWDEEYAERAATPMLGVGDPAADDEGEEPADKEEPDEVEPDDEVDGEEKSVRRWLRVVGTSTRGKRG